MIHFLLDTNAWLRLFVAPHKINALTLERLRREEQVGISPFSYIEVSQKSSKEKLFPESVGDWFSKAIPPGKIIPFPITPEIACLAYDLGPDFHGDPADRIIAATAILHQLTLVTSDIKLLAYPRLRTLNT